MAVALDKYVGYLREAGLIPPAELASLLAELPDARKADGEQLARELVKRNKLTAFQAREIYAGRGKKLTLGNYVILDKLGQGGMGMVLKAEHRRMERIVALKVMSKAAVESPDAVKRFHREVKAAAKLTHPNIVTAFDADESAGTHFLVMEFVAGTDLSQLVKSSGPLPVEKALHCILQAARGLEFAHEHGVVHRDIKPANLLLDAKGNVKILDMGLARIESVGGEQAELTGTGQIMGTVDYMAPEQAMNTRKADARADIYSLGISLWFLLTGRAAYGGETVMEKLMAHQTAPIPRLADHAPGVSPALEAVFQKMVAKLPAERYQSMSEVIAALERARAGAPDIAPTIDIQVNEDDRLSDFLRGIGGGTPSRTSASVAPSAASKPDAATPQAGSTNPSGFEQTIGLPGSTAPAPPASAAPPAAAPPAAAPASPATATPPPAMKPWHQDWKVWAGAGGGSAIVVGLLAAVFNVFGLFNPTTPGLIAKPEPPRHGDPLPESAPKMPVSSVSPLVGNAGGLEFDGKNSHVLLPTLKLPEEDPVTIEAIVTVSSKQQNGAILATTHLRAGSLFMRSGKWLARATAADPKDVTGMEATMPNEQLYRRVHLAAEWDGKQLSLFVDGEISAATAPSSAGANLPAQNVKRVYLGAVMNQGSIVMPFAGVIHQVRFSKTRRFAAAAAPSPPPARLTLDADTLALYHFDEGQGDVLHDASPNQHDGQIVGAKWVGVGTAAPPAVGYALEFDGVDGLVDCGNPTLLDFTGQELTIEAWFLAKRATQSSIAGKSLSSSNDFCLALGEKGEAVMAVFSKEPELLLTGDVVPLNRWTHLAGVYDGELASLYIDGNLVASRAYSGPIAGTDIPFTIGNRREEPLPFQGLIDEVRFSKIARYHARFQPPRRLTLDADTLALYHFDEGQGDVLHDASPNQHDGKIVGAKWVSAHVQPTSSSGAGLVFDGNTSINFDDRIDRFPESCTIEAYVRLAAPSPRGNLYRFATNSGFGLDFEEGTRWRVSHILDPNGHFSAESKSPIELGKRMHVAAVLDSAGFTLYQDGKLIGKSPPLRDQKFKLGRTPSAIGPGFKGAIESVRVSRGSRYAGEFTSPSSLTADAETLGLYLLQAGQGEVATDSSGHDRHGKIVRGK